jgi:membrane-bound metal-dependent hydrolase YbcI (DUF457 family)
MSSGKTHLLIGAVAGLSLSTRVAPELGLPVHGAVAAVSALLATWPDLDEPGSWLSRRLRTATIGLGAVVGLAASASVFGTSFRPLVLPRAELLCAGLVGGALVGWLVERVVLRLLIAVSGGHREGTHGLVAPLLLALAARSLVGTERERWAVVPILLIWGWALHLVGDVVTPQGWRPLAPFVQVSVRLPHAVAVHGEKLALAASLLAGLAVFGAWPR